MVTEAGFGADLGAEKFLDIKCRQSGLRPDAVVLVCTVRALKMHGGVAQGDLADPDVGAVRAGAANLVRHIENLKAYGLPPVVAINHFNTDTADEVAAIEDIAAECGVRAVPATHWADGGAGATGLAEAVMDRLGQEGGRVDLLYGDEASLHDKIDTVARRIYGASGIAVEPEAAPGPRDVRGLGLRSPAGVRRQDAVQAFPPIPRPWAPRSTTYCPFARHACRRVPVSWSPLRAPS